MIEVDGETETLYYYHYDGLGSVIAIADKIAVPAKHMLYLGDTDTDMQMALSAGMYGVGISRGGGAFGERSEGFG